MSGLVSGVWGMGNPKKARTIGTKTSAGDEDGGKVFFLGWGYRKEMEFGWCGWGG